MCNKHSICCLLVSIERAVKTTRVQILFFLLLLLFSFQQMIHHKRYVVCLSFVVVVHAPLILLLLLLNVMLLAHARTERIAITNHQILNAKAEIKRRRRRSLEKQWWPATRECTGIRKLFGHVKVTPMPEYGAHIYTCSCHR